MNATFICCLASNRNWPLLSHSCTGVPEPGAGTDIIDNINIHFGEVATEDELSDYHTEATRAITEGDVCAEFDSLNIEIEYGAELQD